MKQAKMTKRPGKLPAVSIPGKVKKGFPIPKDEIDKINKLRNEKIVFSFYFFDREHEAFNLGNIKLSWFVSLLDIFKEVSCLTRNRLVVEQRNYYEAHQHDWSKLDYKYSFSDDFLEQIECMQFRLSQSDGRVHGFIIGNRFYVVWLDPHHNLYPSDKHGGRKFNKKQWNCFEKLYAEHEELKQDYDNLMNMLDEYTKPEEKLFW